MEEPKVFKFSNKAITEIKQRYLALQILLPIVLIIFLAFSPLFGSITTIPKGALIGIGFFTFVIIEVEFILVSRFMLKRMMELSLALSEEYIVRSWRKSSERIPLEEIQKVVINEKPSGEIAYLDMHYGKKNIYIHGFDEMSEIAQHIQARMSASAVVKRKKQLTDWNNPLVLVGIGILTVAAILLIQHFGGTAYSAFNIIFSAAVGTLLLTFKPISKSAGKRFEKFEIVMGIFLFICAFLLFIIFMIKPNLYDFGW